MTRKTIYIDSDNFSTYKEFLKYMSEKLFIENDGMPLNGLDALEDALEGGFGIYDEGSLLLIKWSNFKKSFEDLGYESTIVYYLELLSNCHPSAREDVKFLLDCAKQNIGQTLFYLILDIFFSIENVSIELY